MLNSKCILEFSSKKMFILLFVPQIEEKNDFKGHSLFIDKVAEK